VLTLFYRGTRRADHKAKWVAGQTGELTPTVSRAGPMPQSVSAKEVVPSEAALVAAGMALFQKVGGAGALPCTRLGLCATKFVEQPAASILSFWAPKPPAAPLQAGTATAAAPSSLAEGGGQEEEEEEEEEAIEPVLVVVEDGDEDEGENEEGQGSTTRPCAKCGGKPIAEEEWAEHADWHVAVELQRTYGGGGGCGGDGGGGSSNNSNKRPGSASHAPGRPGKSKKGSSSSSSSSSSSGAKSQTLDKFWKKK
jgi:hypothetical protein